MAHPGVANKDHKPFRWSPWLAWMETGRSLNTIRAGLRANNISPGPDGKYSTRDIVAAIVGKGHSLKAEAEEAKHQKAITEAEAAKVKLEQLRNKLVSIDEVREFITDLQTRIAQRLRHSKMPKQEIEEALREMKELSFEPRNGAE